MIPDSKVYDLSHLLKNGCKRLINSLFYDFLIGGTGFGQQYD